jgi:hypothetical protein
MAASTPNPDSPTNTDDRYRLARVAPGTGERRPLTGDYLELVWSELLGPTATMVARRIGRALDEPGRVR